MTVFSHQRLYVVPALGLYAIAATLGARWLAGRLPGAARRARVWIGALAVLALPATAMALRSGAEEGPLARRLLADERRALAATDDPARSRRPLFTDRGGFTSWTTGRPSVWVSREAFDALAANGGAEARRLGLPDPPDSLDGWFHAGHWAPGETPQVPLNPRPITPAALRATPGRIRAPEGSSACFRVYGGSASAAPQGAPTRGRKGHWRTS